MVHPIFRLFLFKMDHVYGTLAFVVQVDEIEGMDTHNMPLRLAVFDCDGTLVDSLGAIVYAMNEAFTCHGLPRLDEATVRRVVGLPLEIAIQNLVEGASLGFALEMSESYKTAFSDLRESGGVREPMFAGIYDVLTRLESERWVLGIATGKSSRGLKRTLDHHGVMDRFVTHQTADTAQGKPHPEMMLNAMAETGATPDQSVMIGDTTFDIEMANNAGVKSIGVAWGYHETDELKDAGATYIVHNVDDLIESLFKAMEKPA